MFLPSQLGGSELIAWRLDAAQFSTTWNTGEGAFRFGGRWNSKGVRAVYCSLDAATAILEVAVHKGFRTLDTEPHRLTALAITDPSWIHVVEPASIPNPNWLRPGVPSAGQQVFGDKLLAQHGFVALPSTVSTYSWNLIFNATAAADRYDVLLQTVFALDPRLHPVSV